jgi:GTP-binding protein
MTLEEAIHFIRDDEMVEVTPSSIRIRKVELNAGKRHILAGKLKKKDAES